MSERVFSGIQPSGSLHLGNYFGAIRHWVRLQNEFESIFSIVDYHALSGDFSPEKLSSQTLEMILDLLACGIDPEKAILFIQSHVPIHAELTWILSAFTSYGDLTRMTQFKGKADKSKFVNVALFSYPILQAADILIYKASKVPVGEDQLQHLELVRSIANRFNRTLKTDFFPEVQPLISSGARIMSLADPTSKMSKSLGEKHYIGLMEDKKSIHKKIRSAVTDTGLEEGQTMSLGVQNLFTLLELSIESSANESQSADIIEDLRKQHNAGELKYSDLKDQVYEAVIRLLKPIRQKRRELTQDDAYRAIETGREKAQSIASEVIKEVRSLIGLLPRK